MKGSPAGVCLFVFIMREGQNQPLPQPITATEMRKSLDRALFLIYIDSKL